MMKQKCLNVDFQKFAQMFLNSQNTIEKDDRIISKKL